MTLLALAAVVSTVTVACGSDKGSSGASGSGSASGSASGSGSASAPATTPKFASNQANTVVSVEAYEYAFKLDQPQAAGPKVFFTVKNTGKEEHEFEILGPDGKAVDEIEAFDAGLTKTLAAELPAGTYTFQCILEKDGKTHAQLGMTTKYTIT